MRPRIMSAAEAASWASTAEREDYLGTYVTAGVNCGYSDAVLDLILSVLSDRGLGLTADDRGLVVS